jgi:acetyl esterase
MPLLQEEEMMKCRLLFIPVTIFVLALFSSCFDSESTAQEKEPRYTDKVDFPFGNRPKAQEIRDWINNHPQQGRKEAIAAFYARIGKPYLDRTRKQREYKPPGISDADTREFVFKRTPQRDLKLFVDYPADWKKSDRRPAIVFWHGGGFTQGNAGQFYYQANYFAERGAVCFRPEYRVRDTDNTLPVTAVEDGVSALCWIKQRADEFGLDPDRIAVGGGSAGGCMAAAVATVDAARFAKLGFVGKEDGQTIDTKVSAMILYNPFLDFFEPTHPRQIEEECLFLGKDPEDYCEALHTISAIENVTMDSPPNIILFGTKDAFYVSDLRWIVKCREIGAECRDFVYKGEVHSWYNNSPHLEYTTRNVNEFLVDIGLLERQPEVELPHKEISAGRSDIQDAKYGGKKDWDEIPKYRRYREENNIDLILFKHYEMESKHASKPLFGRLARQDRNSDGKLQADEIPAKVRDEILRDLDKDKNNVLEGPEIEALLKKYFSTGQGNR